MKTRDFCLGKKAAYEDCAMLFATLMKTCLEENETMKSAAQESPTAVAVFEEVKKLLGAVMLEGAKSCMAKSKVAEVEADNVE